MFAGFAFSAETPRPSRIPPLTAAAGTWGDRRCWWPVSNAGCRSPPRRASRSDSKAGCVHIRCETGRNLHRRSAFPRGNGPRCRGMTAAAGSWRHTESLVARCPSWPGTCRSSRPRCGTRSRCLSRTDHRGLRCRSLPPNRSSRHGPQSPSRRRPSRPAPTSRRCPRRQRRRARPSWRPYCYSRRPTRPRRTARSRDEDVVASSMALRSHGHRQAPQVQKHALTQIRGAGSPALQPHISLGPTQSVLDVHSL